MNNYSYIGGMLLALGVMASLVSCDRFLDAKPSKSIIHANTLADLQLILNDDKQINANSTGLLEIAADGYEFDISQYGNLSAFERQMYAWAPSIQYEFNHASIFWHNPYRTIYVANIVLEELVNATDRQKPEAKAIEGSALFFRAWTLFHQAQVFCLPYDPSGNNQGLGVPIKLSSNHEEPTVRPTIQQTYERILLDMNKALELLPDEHATYVTRPTKVAAYAALARIYLAMEQYEQAGHHAHEALQRFSRLSDFKDYNLAVNEPFEMDNEQIILYMTAAGPPVLLHPLRGANVPADVYDSYEENDLRKKAFFLDVGNGNHAFKARYVAPTGATYFVGLATDELFLIRAECHARANRPIEAMNDLNHLLSHRWEQGTFMPFAAADADQALRVVLDERRKELLMRGVRWSDLRRLNRDPRFAKTLVREVDRGNGTETVALAPNDRRYALPIPQLIIDMAGIPQNER